MEILLCVHDRPGNGDLFYDSHLPKQGDVVTVQENGWPWSDAELGVPIKGNPNGNHPFFRVIKLPNVPVSVGTQLMSSEVDTDPLNPSPYLQYRGFYLDKTKIPGSFSAVKANIADDLRTNGFVTSSMSATQFQSLISQRTPVQP